jgi:hypothetical protein
MATVPDVTSNVRWFWLVHECSNKLSRAAPVLLYTCINVYHHQSWLLVTIAHFWLVFLALPQGHLLMKMIWKYFRYFLVNVLKKFAVGMYISLLLLPPAPSFLSLPSSLFLPLSSFLSLPSSLFPPWVSFA